MPYSSVSYTKHAFFASSHLNIIDLFNGPSQSQLAGVGLVLAFAVVWVLARRDRQPVAESFATLGLAAVAAILGARGWALVEWRLADRDALWIWDLFEPAGYSSGGAIFGAGAVILATRMVFGSDSFAKLIDIVAPAGFVALALTRLGCLFEGCDIGLPTTFGVVHVPGGPPVHAFGAYIAVPMLLVIAGLCLTNWRPGARAFAAASAYAIVRFVAEFFRAGASAPNVGQLLCVALLLGVGAWWWFDGRGASRTTK